MVQSDKRIRCGILGAVNIKSLFTNASRQTDVLQRSVGHELSVTQQQQQQRKRHQYDA